MRSLLKKLLIILFLSNFTYLNLNAANDISVSLLILDKSSSTKYNIEFSNEYLFRDISFEMISCEELILDKYIDQIALLKIKQKNESFIGWFFKYTDELNLYSNKIYEITLKNCFTKNQ